MRRGFQKTTVLCHTLLQGWIEWFRSTMIIESNASCKAAPCTYKVACGGGQQGSTAAITEDGTLFTFGNNYKAHVFYT